MDHPSGQIEIVNEVFTPTKDESARRAMLRHMRKPPTRAGSCAAMFEGEMIDEANRKMARRSSSRSAGWPIGQAP